MPSDAPYGMPDYILKRILQKRGRLHVFDRFEPSRTALVVIDMQELYIDDLPSARDIVPAINRLAQEFRARGGCVAWVSMTVGREGRSLWPLYHANFFGVEGGARHRDQLSEGAKGHRLHRDLVIEDGDIFASKQRFSAFLADSCDLHEQLRERGIDNVAIVGVATNACCETSARDAMMMDYRVAMVVDANAARFEQDHQYSLWSVFQNFGDIYTAEELLRDVLR